MKLEDVELKIAIGIGDGGCVVEIIKGGQDIATDADGYGGSLDDFFYEGSEIPKEAGIYTFTGESRGIPGSDLQLSYHGVFTLNT